MKCPICKEGTMKKGNSTLTVERKGAIIFFKQVPALVCNNCGESFFTSDVSKQVYKIAEEAFNKGTELEVIKMKKNSLDFHIKISISYICNIKKTKSCYNL